MLQDFLVQAALIVSSILVVILFIFILWVVVWKLFLKRFKFIQALTEAKSEEEIKAKPEQRAPYRTRLRARQAQS